MTLLYLILILFFIIALLIGFFFVFKPELMIEIQRRFYAQINWKIEPISKELEIRNTRLMGIFLIIVSLAALFCAFRISPPLGNPSLIFLDRVFSIDYT